MKIWYGYGTEHSMNLVMIGKFVTEEDSKKTFELLKELELELSDKIEVGSQQDRYSDEVLEILRRLKIHIIGPAELEQFLYDHSLVLDGDTIVLTTDESEVSAYLKTMVEKGGKVEVFSAHDYPDSDYGRGKTPGSSP